MAIEIIIFQIIVLVFSVVIHETAHGFMADYLGDPTARLAGRLTLNPIKHLDPIGSVALPLLLVALHSPFLIGWAKPVPFNPYNLSGGRWGPAYVSVAGPASNIVIAALFGLLIRFGGASLPAEVLPLLAAVVLINLILAIFNLIPVPPLDGSKILFAFLPYRWADIERAIYQYQFVILLVILLLGWRLIIPIVFWLFTLFTGL